MLSSASGSALKIKRKRPVRFEIIPMIDVFMIIALFLMVMAFLPQISEALKADLPSNKAPDKAPQSLVVQLTRDGAIEYDGGPIAPEVLQARMKAAVAGQPDVSVIIAADKNLPYQKVIDLIGTLKTAGIKRLALATAKPQ